MNRHLWRALRAVSLTTALTVTASLAAPAAHAEDVPIVVDVTTDGGDDTTAPVAELADDGLATALDTIDSAVRRCDPVARTWRNVWYEPVPYTTANGSTWYTLRGGGEAQLNCAAAVQVRASIFDESAPGFEVRRGDSGWISSTDATPRAVASLNVPYVGPDAPGVRPYGQVTIRVELRKRLSTGRYQRLTNGCVEFYLVHQPAVGLVQPDPTKNEGFGSAECPAVAKTLFYDTYDNITAT